MKTNRKDVPRHHNRLFLKEWVRYRHITLQKLAELVDTSKGTISNLQSGENRYNADWLEQIAFALNCEVPDLFYSPEQAHQRRLPTAWQDLLSAGIAAAADARVSPLVVDEYFRAALGESARGIVQQIAATNLTAEQYLSEAAGEALDQSRTPENASTPRSGRVRKKPDAAHKEET